MNNKSPTTGTIQGRKYDDDMNNVFERNITTIQQFDHRDSHVTMGAHGGGNIINQSPN